MAGKIEEEINRLNDNKEKHTFHSRNFVLKQSSLAPVNWSRLLTGKTFKR
jgi:hypothetical protein